MRDSPKNIISGEILPLMKKNGFLHVSACDLKLNYDGEKNEYVTAVCYNDKFINPKAQILVDKSGAILCHNASLASVFSLNKLMLGHMGVKKIEELVDFNMSKIKRSTLKTPIETSLVIKKSFLESKIQPNPNRPESH